jgi:NADPH-dependent 2,4-dienoyl-CoA reductase/sulfur reductase-like enzyme/rhodanese-related sulfurtransferase
MSKSNSSRKVLIVGGVAGGASCAARLRRLDEKAEIILVDRGPHVSFANCGLPYYIGGVIEQEKSLLIADGKLFRERFNIEVRTRTEVVSIDREKKQVGLRDLASGKTCFESYDSLVLSPGASPLRPPLPGIDLPGIFTMRNIPDSLAIKDWVKSRASKKAVVVGGGFIGLEMTENLQRLGVEVTVVEMLDQVMPPLDSEMAAMVAVHLQKRGVKLALGDGVAGFEQGASGGLSVKTKGGASYAADLVILSIGVRPETKLAVAAGLELGPRGGIRVDEQMRTSDASIWAVGDAVEVRDWVTGLEALIPLAGPANRQGRIAADAICGRDSSFRGVQGTAICGVLGQIVAMTGASEKSLKRAGIADYEKVYVHPGSHAGYYPGAEKIHLKLLFRKSDGRILGAQAVGGGGVDKRIDVIAMAIQKNGTVYDLEEAELCYAPQFGGAKDPVNFAGMVAANVLRGDMPVAHWNEPAGEGTVYLDVRDEDEFASGHLPSAVNIPLNSLRDNIGSLPDSNDLRVYCAVGLRGYLATRLLTQRGVAARNVSGGWSSAPAARNK